MSWTDLELAEVRAIGDQRGVFARTDIPEGVVVGVFDGIVEMFSVDENDHVDWRGQDGGMSIHLRLAGGKLFALMPIPGVEIYGIDYINHSCNPNCESAPGLLVVVTTRLVRKGEQLTVDYHAMDCIKLGRPCWCEHVPAEQRCIL